MKTSFYKQYLWWLFINKSFHHKITVSTIETNIGSALIEICAPLARYDTRSGVINGERIVDTVVIPTEKATSPPQRYDMIFEETPPGQHPTSISPSPIPSESPRTFVIKQVAAMTKISEKENAAELMLQAKGFENAMVSISSGNADVIVSSEGLTNKQIAQIEDIVKRKTGITADKIVITPVNVK